MNHKILLLLSTFLVNACAMNSHFSPEQTLTVDYMQTGNAISDAKIAITNSNFTLIGFDQRGLIIPGVKSKMIESTQKHCSIKRIIGMGDVVRSPEHLKRMKKVRAYSKAYNLEILDTTSCKQ